MMSEQQQQQQQQLSSCCRRRSHANSYTESQRKTVVPGWGLLYLSCLVIAASSRQWRGPFLRFYPVAIFNYRALNVQTKCVVCGKSEFRSCSSSNVTTTTTTCAVPRLCCCSFFLVSLFLPPFPSDVNSIGYKFKFVVLPMRIVGTAGVVGPLAGQQQPAAPM